MEHENEKLEPAFEKEILIKQEFEKIERAEKKMCERYHGYEELTEFIVYLASMEKVFAQARVYEQTTLLIKEELIDAEVRMFGRHSLVGPDVLRDIKRDFIAACEGIKDVYNVTQNLLEKYAMHPDCKEFIVYLRDVTIDLLQKTEVGITLDEIRAHLYIKKMHQLTADGDPEISVLERIYEEFNAQLSKV